MRALRRSLTVAAVLALGGALLSACGSSGGSNSGGGNGSTASSGQVTKIRVAGNKNATALPLWVASEQGIFKKNGLDVTYTTVGDISTLIPALGKSFDVVLTTPVNIISAGAQGIPVTWVSGSSIDEGDQTSNTRLIAGAKSGITSIDQLKGKTIGTVASAGTAHIATLYWLKQAGVPLNSIKTIQIAANQQADQLKAGRVDAVEAVHPFAEDIIAAGGHNLGSPYAHLAPTIAGIVWASTQSWASGHAAAITAFRKSLDEAQTYIKANNGAARKLLAEKTGLPAKVANSTILPLFNTDVRSQDLPVWEHAMKETTGFKGNPDLSKLTFMAAGPAPTSSP